jgi:hypothetical protein
MQDVIHNLMSQYQDPLHDVTVGQKCLDLFHSPNV